MTITPFPIHPGIDRLARLQGRHAVRRDMKVIAGFGVFDAIDNLHPAAIATFQIACIARLAASHRIENRHIQNDAAFIGADDPGLARLPIGILAKQFFRHAAIPPARI